MARITDLNRYRRVYPTTRARRRIPDRLPIETITSSKTVSRRDYIVQVNHTAAVTVTLPGSPDVGEMYVVKDISGGAGEFNITVNTADSKTFDSNVSTYVIGTDYQSTAFVWDGTFWRVL